MSDDKKDKIIYGLIIAVFILIANFAYSNNIGGIFDKSEKITLVDEGDLSDEDNNIDSNTEESTNDSIKKVYISGEINKPGVYQIKDGDRLEDLINEAGGLTDKASDKTLNLAQRLDDQMKIYIPNIDEENSLENIDPNQSASQSPSKTSELININTASKEELMTLPNIGDKRADAIIEYRNANKFEKIEDIKNVTGIGDKFYEALKDLITI
ncbi:MULTISPECIES: helix-hairpin-helix domain-containing protein [Anaerococcus]|uniref:helix-hairpin-helix domain-containing protein n=1 Tax=Anaerococcus TaxID=165779 RepID=UPI0027B9BA9D|nr:MULTISPECIES: helix-hairpin-helix domain-containing protein [Anaerococcus]MDU2557345.1 helix-hairpin-helix domain-containing protein [Anaerococcus prevotii]MDU2583877.1 helix-hairpin-helix domain-containing protein [Anaerococcus prevotii]MDU3136304.1 helix-hairpin-helix domain-containing protein [Anaerococcus prevotii]